LPHHVVVVVVGVGKKPVCFGAAECIYLQDLLELELRRNL